LWEGPSAIVNWRFKVTPWRCKTQRLTPACLRAPGVIPKDGRHGVGSDPYNKLRPLEATPDDELCTCENNPPIKLMCALGYNPVNCVNCNLEVRPEILQPDPQLVDAIAHWRWIYDAIDHLWLDSAEYEQWAREQLSDISSPVHKHGRHVQQELNNLRRCYYWVFQDQSADDYEPISNCPSCGRPMLDYEHGIFKQLVCEQCSIVTVGE